MQELLKQLELIIESANYVPSTIRDEFSIFNEGVTFAVEQKLVSYLNDLQSHHVAMTGLEKRLQEFITMINDRKVTAPELLKYVTEEHNDALNSLSELNNKLETVKSIRRYINPRGSLRDF